jgi:hypothetical protein
MNTVVTTAPGRQEHPPQPVYIHAPHPARRVGLIDRTALRLGVALVAWSRRPLAFESRERLANRAEQHVARLAREAAAARWIGLNLPPR